MAKRPTGPIVREGDVGAKDRQATWRLNPRWSQEADWKHLLRTNKDSRPLYSIYMTAQPSPVFLLGADKPVIPSHFGIVRA